MRVGFPGFVLVLLLAAQAAQFTAGRKLLDGAQPGAEAPAAAQAPGAASAAPAPAPGPGQGQAQADVDVSADVYNGQPAPEGLFDFMVRIKVSTVDELTGAPSSSHMCGGTLLDATTVLTAAHCLVFEDGTLPAEALILENRGVAYQASNVLTHSGYSPSALDAQNTDFSDGSVDNALQPLYDVAVIKLATPVPDPVTAQLPSADLLLQPGQALEVAGWGRTGSSEDLPASEALLYTPLEYAAPFDFANPSAPGTCLAPSFTDVICAGNFVTGGNACQGDSGGPLLLRDFLTGAATVVGVVSNGPPCSDISLGFYTDVRLYLTEIAGTML